MSQGIVIFRVKQHGEKVWTYGWWGGGWSAGRFLDDGEPTDPTFPVIDGLDAVFKNHDLGYAISIEAWNSSDRSHDAKLAFWDGILAADLRMVESIKLLFQSGELSYSNDPASTNGQYTAAAEALAAFQLIVMPANEAARDRFLPPEHLSDTWRKSNERWDRFWEGLEQGLLNSLLRLSNFLNTPFGRVVELSKTAANYASPLALDLDGNGIQTVGLSSGVHFDHAADGFAERTGWISGGDGLLVRDLNGNGTIDSGRELFGSETLLANGSMIAADDQHRGALMLGGYGADILMGGDGDDLLIGGPDADTLLGGDGYDIYRADILDTISDSDGEGEVALDGRLLHGGVRKKSDPPNLYIGDFNTRYVLEGCTLTINGGLVITGQDDRIDGRGGKHVQHARREAWACVHLA